MMKRIISCLLVCFLLLGLCPAALAAAGSPTATAAVTANAQGSATVVLTVKAGSGSSHGRVTATMPAGLTLASARSLLGSEGIADLSSTKTSLRFAWACYADLKKDTAALELKLTGKPGVYALQLSLPETKETVSVSVEIPGVFRDVSADDWFFNAVYDAYGRGLMVGESSDLFAPNDSMTRAMLITTLYRMSGSPAVTGENPYSDVPAGSYYEKAVIWAMQKGVANGMGGGKFEPDTTLNRAMVATVLYRLSGDKVSATNAFPDVPANEWYGEAVAWAQQKGIVTGFEDGTFRPMEEISRQDMALMLQRYAKTVKGTDTTPTGDLSRWPDAGLVGSWAVDALRWCVGAGIINGKDGGLQPAGNATRAEFATILMRYAKL